MRFLLVNFEYPPIGGGAGRVTQILAEELEKIGHEVVILTSKYQEKSGVTKKGNISIHRIWALRKHFDRTKFIEMFSFIISAVFKLKGIVKEYSIDSAIIFFSIPCGPVGLALKKFHNIPYVVSMHGMDVPGADKTLNTVHNIVAPIRRKVLKGSLANVAVSKSFKKQSEAIDKFPVEYIPNGVRTDFFKPIEEYQIKDEYFRLIFVGRFHPVKNLEYLLKRLKEICEINNKIKLMMVGNGPLMERLKALSHDLGIEDNIEWYPWVDQKELVRLYNHADCFVLLSHYEGMPLTALEAMSCGLPFVASKVLGNVEVVRHGENGFLFELDKPKDFVSSILEIAEKKEIAERFSKYSRKWMLEEFAWNKIANKFVRLFKDKKHG